jgi:hypothetical protein
VLSRPASLREWIWLAVAAVAIGAALEAPGGLATSLEHSATVLVTGGVLALTLWRPQPIFRRAALAALAALAAVVVWCAVYGVTWGEVEAATRGEWSTWRTATLENVRRQDPPLDVATQARLESLTNSVAETAPTLYPALLFLAALLGPVVAWGWYHRIARRPLPPAPGRFAEFRFNDHAVWVVVAALGLLLAAPSETLRDVGRNLLFVGAVLYGLRGLAVVAYTGARTPRAVLVTLAFVSLFLFPFVAGGLVLLGLADTWLDFRRRPAPSPPGGMHR